MSEKEYIHIFATNLKRLLAEHDMTQAELAAALGVSGATVHSWVHEQKTPRMGKVDKMCELFGCKRSDLMQDHTEEQNYFIDSQAKELAEFLFENPQHKVLFDASRNVKAEDIEKVIAMINLMTGE